MPHKASTTHACDLSTRIISWLCTAQYSHATAVEALQFCCRTHRASHTPAKLQYVYLLPPCRWWHHDDRDGGPSRNPYDNTTTSNSYRQQAAPQQQQQYPMPTQMRAEAAEFKPQPQPQAAPQAAPGFSRAAGPAVAKAQLPKCWEVRYPTSKYDVRYDTSAVTSSATYAAWLSCLSLLSCAGWLASCTASLLAEPASSASILPRNCAAAGKQIIHLRLGHSLHCTAFGLPACSLTY